VVVVALVVVALVASEGTFFAPTKLGRRHYFTFQCAPI
tara:strand:+ start:67 stop:180 length:114 start_codon:yes stop_codon:yes gene_type:complete